MRRESRRERRVDGSTLLQRDAEHVEKDERVHGIGTTAVRRRNDFVINTAAAQRGSGTVDESAPSHWLHATPRLDWGNVDVLTSAAEKQPERPIVRAMHRDCKELEKRRLVEIVVRAAHKPVREAVPRTQRRRASPSLGTQRSAHRIEYALNARRTRNVIVRFLHRRGAQERGDAAQRSELRAVDSRGAHRGECGGRR